MSSPSKLDRLYRFYRHEEDGSAYGCFWNVSAGSLEGRQRLYRILYESNVFSFRQEITIDVKKPELLKDFFALIVGVLEQPKIDPAFHQACKDLLAEDPWLSLFSYSTNTPQLPYMYDGGVVLTSDVPLSLLNGTS